MSGGRRPTPPRGTARDPLAARARWPRPAVVLEGIERAGAVYAEEILNR